MPPTDESRGVDAYLALLPPDQRAALEHVRAAIRAAVPGAEECLSYQRPAFRLDGKVLVAYGAAARHCALYPMSGSTIAAHRPLLAGYQTSRGTVRFPASAPIPDAIIRTLVEARVRENAGR